MYVVYVIESHKKMKTRDHDRVQLMKITKQNLILPYIHYRL